VPGRGARIAELFSQRQFPHCAVVYESSTFEAEFPLAEQRADDRSREPSAAPEPAGNPLLFGDGFEAQWSAAHVDEIEAGRIDSALF